MIMKRLLLVIISLCIALESGQKSAKVQAAKPNVCRTIDDYSLLKRNPDCWFSPNVGSSTPYMISRNGYQAEMHVVTTEDGYLLTVYRIPYKKSNLKNERNRLKAPLLLAHGISVSSDNFVDRGPDSIDESERASATNPGLAAVLPNLLHFNAFRDYILAYKLSDANYDVWLPNFRGNYYSTEHLEKSATDFDFWNFTFHEVGIYDLPAVIDYIRNYTNYEEIFYVGNSMGGTIVYVMLSERPEYNKYIKAMSTISPVVHMANIRGVVPKITRWHYEFHTLMDFFGVGKFVPLIDFNRKLISFICSSSSLGLKLCQSVIGLIFGFSYDHVESFVFPIIVSRTPSGTSMKSFVHYAQILDSGGSFRKFDYGPHKNAILYGSREAPLYNLQNIDTPILILYSQNDRLSPKEDNQILASLLKCNTTVMDVENENYNHMDFIYAKDSTHLVYKPIIKFLRQFKLRHNYI